MAIYKNENGTMVKYAGGSGSEGSCDAKDVNFANGSNLEEVSSSINQQIENLSAEMNAVKKSVSDGKTSVANAITAKGVTTATDATFAVMAENIGAIETSSGMSLNVFTQENEPEAKDGVWIQTNNPYENIVVGSETYDGDGTVIDSWNSSPTPPAILYQGSAVVFDNKIHILGSGSFDYKDKHYSFYISGWTEVGTLPYNFYDGCAIVYDNKIHILGSGDNSCNTKHYAFDGSGWTEISTLPYEFYYGSAVVYNNKIHILGGSTTSGSNTTKTTKHYAFDGENWTEIGTLPYEFYGGSAVVYDNKIHILGSYNSNNRTKHYAFDGESWTEVSALPYLFYDGCAIVYDNKIHILGSGNGTDNYKHYSFNGSSWSSVSVLPSRLFRNYAVVYNNKIHILGNPNNIDADKNFHYYSTFVSASQHDGNTVAIYQNPDKISGNYSTNFITEFPISGKNNKFPSGFDDVFYIDKSGNVEESPTYYGDGTQWVKFKN